MTVFREATEEELREQHRSLRQALDHMAAESVWNGETSARQLYNQLICLAQQRSHKEAADFLELVLSGMSHDPAAHQE